MSKMSELPLVSGEGRETDELLVVRDGAARRILGEAYLRPSWDHIGDICNPHKVTAEQIGAVSKEELSGHKEAKNNPHKVTAKQIGAASLEEIEALSALVRVNRWQELVPGRAWALDCCNLILQRGSFLGSLSGAVDVYFPIAFKTNSVTIATATVGNAELNEVLGVKIVGASVTRERFRAVTTNTYSGVGTKGNTHNITYIAVGI